MLALKPSVIPVSIQDAFLQQKKKSIRKGQRSQLHTESRQPLGRASASTEMEGELDSPSSWHLWHQGTKSKLPLLHLPSKRSICLLRAGTQGQIKSPVVMMPWHGAREHTATHAWLWTSTVPCTFHQKWGLDFYCWVIEEIKHTTTNE